LFLGLLYKQIWFVWFVKAVANAKKKTLLFRAGSFGNNHITLCCANRNT
jgi:hypothetical protein